MKAIKSKILILFFSCISILAASDNKDSNKVIFNDEEQFIIPYEAGPQYEAEFPHLSETNKKIARFYSRRNNEIAKNLKTLSYSRSCKQDDDCLTKEVADFVFGNCIHSTSQLKDRYVLYSKSSKDLNTIHDYFKELQINGETIANTHRTLSQEKRYRGACPAIAISRPKASCRENICVIERQGNVTVGTRPCPNDIPYKGAICSAQEEKFLDSEYHTIGTLQKLKKQKKIKE